MDQREYEELFRHIRTAVQATGRSELDIRIVESQRLYDARGSSEDVESYLEALRQEVVLGSSGALRQTMEHFRRVQSPDGRGITGIVVDVQERDRASYAGLQTVDLVGSLELDELVTELGGLLARIREDQTNE